MLVFNVDTDVKSENYKPQPEQKSEENTRTTSSSAVDSGSIHFRCINTVKQIQEIIQIQT